MDATSNFFTTHTSLMFFMGTGILPYYSIGIPIDASPGPCLSLIVLAAIFRFLLAFKSVLEKRGMDAEGHRRYTVNVRKTSTGARTSSDFKGVGEGIIVVRRHVKRMRSWQTTIDGPRAAIDTVIIGVLYLLMLFLMKMNIGYALSILCGTVLGNLAVRRYLNEALSRRTIVFVIAVVVIIMAGDLY